MENYPTGNKDLISSLSLQKCPEGGYFVETDRQAKLIPSPYADMFPRNLATTIYYLLTYDSPFGFIHMNKSIIHHILHQGRAEYTIITPGVNGKPAKIETKILGMNTEAGETRQLFVGSGVWKMSRLLPEDRKLPTSDGIFNTEKADKVGCLITEVVVPGFQYEDHQYLSLQGLAELFADETIEEREKIIARFTPFIKRD